MSNGSVQTGKARIGLLAVFASCCLVVAALFGASQAKAATIGDPVNADFNYVGIDVNTSLGGVSDLVLTPSAALGELELRGTYTSEAGDFTVPQTGGLNFPDIALDLGGIDLEAQIKLTEDATGTLDTATGAMTFNPSISLTIGVSDVAALPIPGLGVGALRCELAPLAVSLSTSNGWPAAGDAFDAGPGTLKNGSVAGAWDVKPNIVAKEGLQGTCDLIGSLLEPVGGLWIGQSDSLIEALPAATSAKPEPAVCGPDQTGVPPTCVDNPPPPVLRAARVVVQGKPRAVTIKRGRRGVVRVTVRNSGQKTAARVRVCGRISGRVARSPRCVNLGNIAGGKRKTAVLRLSTTRRSRGRANMSITVTSRGAGRAASRALVKIRR
jgi:hypothetical protein